jgi:cell division FtsZ-interacting protein ZapD
LSAVCSDDKLFLQNDRTAFEACSLNETIRSLVLVHEAINVLYAARSQHNDAFIIAQGHDIGLNIDESFIANYEHLLLRLQSQLIETLTRKVVEALLFNDLDKTQRKLLNWFTEFEGNQHPLNTTWPWSIKPSLAVLWGYV